MYKTTTVSYDGSFLQLELRPSTGDTGSRARLHVRITTGGGQPLEDVKLGADGGTLGFTVAGEFEIRELLTAFADYASSLGIDS